MNCIQSLKVSWPWSYNYGNDGHTINEKIIVSGNSMATYKSVGKTYEGREIPALVITDTTGSNKQTVFFECGIFFIEYFIYSKT